MSRPSGGERERGDPDVPDPAQDGAAARRICAWCNAALGEVVEATVFSTHGICEPCLVSVGRRLVPPLRPGRRCDPDDA